MFTRTTRVVGDTKTERRQYVGRIMFGTHEVYRTTRMNSEGTALAAAEEEFADILRALATREMQR